VPGVDLSLGRIRQLPFEVNLSANSHSLVPGGSVQVSNPSNLCFARKNNGPSHCRVRSRESFASSSHPTEFPSQSPCKVLFRLYEVETDSHRVDSGEVLSVEGGSSAAIEPVSGELDRGRLDASGDEGRGVLLKL